MQLSDHLKGILITTLGVLVLSPDALLIRLLEADTLTVLFWRGLTFAIGIVCLMLLMYRQRTLQTFAKIGRPGIINGCIFGISTLCFTAAIQNTSIANALVIVSTSPMFAALFSWLFLKEKIKTKTWVAMLIIMLAIGAIVSSSFGSGKLLGDLFACGTSIFMAVSFTITRRYKAINMVPAMALSGSLVAIVSALLISLSASASFALKPHAVPYLIIAGFTVTLAFALITLGPRYMPAPEVGMIMPLETVIGSLLGWLFLQERPSTLTLLGGFVVIATLVIHAWLSLQDSHQHE